MSLKCGIVGLPNVGKSTLFNALTKAGIAAENYPFCTIEPNVGIVEVPDERLDALSAIVSPQKVQRAIVEFVDIAGRVAGAPDGFRIRLPPKWDRAVSALAIREERQGKAVRICPHPRGRWIPVCPQARA